MVEGGITLVKYLLFLGNFVIWLAGTAMIIAAGVLQMRYTGLFDILGNPWFATPHLLVIVGVTCAVIGFLGCCGSIRENYCLTVSFAVLLSGLLLLEFFGIILVYSFHEQLQRNFETQLQQVSLKQFAQRQNHGYTVAVASWHNSARIFQMFI